MNIFDEIATKIIRGQELIIGPLAWSVAKKVKNLKVENNTVAEIADRNQDAKETIDNLVFQYEKLFGIVSRRVCKNAVKELLSKLQYSEIPQSLK